MINEIVSLNSAVAVSFVLFFIGLFGVATRRDSLVSIFLSLELMLLAACLSFASFASVFEGEMSGAIFCLLALAVGVSEVTIGLVVVIAHFNRKGEANLSGMGRDRVG